MLLLLNTTDSLASVHPARAKHVTHRNVQSTAHTLAGPDSVHVHTHVEAEARPDTDNAEHRNMEVNRAVYSVIQTTSANATPTFAL